MNNKILIVAALAAASIISCRDKDFRTPLVPAEFKGTGENFYLLNQGNFGANNARLDYFSSSSNTYQADIYTQKNPSADKLGDTGNDMKLYGNKLYIAMNGSNKVVVLDATTSVVLGQLNVKQPRFITFKGSKLYVSAYGEATWGGAPMKGLVAIADTSAFQDNKAVAPETTIEVGRQPEGVAIIANHLYVANSGGYSSNNYEKTISVIDLNSNKVTDSIEVAINLYSKLEVDKNSNIWVSSAGNYGNIKGALFVVSPISKKVIKKFETNAGSKFELYGAELHYLSYDRDFATNTSSNFKFGTINVNTFTESNKKIQDGWEQNLVTPSFLQINAGNGNIYIGDARAWIAPSEVFCYKADGTFLWKKTVGSIASNIVFLP